MTGFLEFAKSKVWTREFVGFLWGQVCMILFDVAHLIGLNTEHWIAFVAVVSYFVVLPLIRKHCT